MLWREAPPRDEAQVCWPAPRAVAALPYTVLELPALPEESRCWGQEFREYLVPQQELASVPVAREQF